RTSHRIRARCGGSGLFSWTGHALVPAGSVVRADSVSADDPEAVSVATAPACRLCTRARSTQESTSALLAVAVGVARNCALDRIADSLPGVARCVLRPLPLQARG